jgi:hypothetical protein
MPILTTVCDGEDQGKLVMEHRSNCAQPYGFPANVKYGFPVLKYGFPVQQLYAVMPPQGQGSGCVTPLYNVNSPGK